MFDVRDFNSAIVVGSSGFISTRKKPFADWFMDCGRDGLK